MKRSNIRKLEQKANDGNLKSLLQLYQNYLEGNRVEKDINKATQYANNLIEQLEGISFNLNLIKLTNFRSIKSIKFDFPSNQKCKLTVFVGINGSGKTTFLDAIAKSLSWLIVRTVNQKNSGKGHVLSTSDIKESAPYASVILELSINKYTKYVMELSKPRDGDTRKNDVIEIGQLAELYKFASKNNPDFNLPILAYYSVERSLDIKKKDRDALLNSSGENLDKLDGYSKSLSEIVDFQSFMNWFKFCEETESFHEGEIKEKASFTIQKTKEAIFAFMPEITSIWIQRPPKALDMLVIKNNITLSVLQLSQGEKSLFALVADIVRRLILLNPSLENPLHGEGVILIDEIDLHLHPDWQQKVVPALLRTFPNVHFILSTHSPQVLSTVESDNIYILEDGEIYNAPKGTKGAEASRILKRVLGVDVRPPEDENTKLLNKYLQEYVYKDKWESEHAKELRTQLDKIYEDEEPELTKADLYIENRQWELELEKS